VGQPVLDQRTARQPGERIVDGLVCELRFDLTPFETGLALLALERAPGPLDDPCLGGEECECAEPVPGRDPSVDGVGDAVDNVRGRGTYGTDQTGSESAEPRHEPDAGHVHDRKGQIVPGGDVENEAERDDDKPERDRAQFADPPPTPRHGARVRAWVTPRIR
jgi:hypothetical protein